MTGPQGARPPPLGEAVGAIAENMSQMVRAIRRRIENASNLNPNIEMKYVDGFVIPLPRKNLAQYRRIASQACKVWMEHGALEYRECVGEDMDIKMVLPFPKLTKVKKGETVVFAWIGYKSRRHRDQVNAKVMKDPRMEKMMDGKQCPFDPKRMSYGGFEVIVAG